MIGLASSTRMLRSTSQNFFALPPAHRLSLYEQSLQRSTHHSPRRAFSATTSRRYDLYSSVMTVPAALLDVVHLTGLPWCAVIPATAVLVRGGLVYHFCTKPAHLSQNKLSHLYPLLQARLSSKLRYFSRPAANDPFRHKINFVVQWFLARFKLTRQLKDTFGLPRTWRTAVPTYLSLFIMAEAIRVRCGVSSGLLQVLLSPVSWWEGLKLLWQIILWQPRPKSAASTSSPAADISSAPNPFAVQSEAISRADPSSVLDPTLAVEGFSWCPDLTVADPTGALPSLLFMTLAIPALTRALLIARTTRPSVVQEKDEGAANSEDASKKSLYQPDEHKRNADAVVKSLLGSTTFAFVFMLLLSKLPAGVLLYIVANQATAAVQRLWLQFKYPAGRTILPCSRPMRVRVRNKYGGIKYQ